MSRSEYLHWWLITWRKVTPRGSNLTSRKLHLTEIIFYTSNWTEHWKNRKTRKIFKILVFWVFLVFLCSIWSCEVNLISCKIIFFTLPELVSQTFGQKPTLNQYVSSWSHQNCLQLALTRIITVNYPLFLASWHCLFEQSYSHRAFV